MIPLGSFGIPLSDCPCGCPELIYAAMLMDLEEQGLLPRNVLECQHPSVGTYELRYRSGEHFCADFRRVLGLESGERIYVFDLFKVT